MFSKSTVRCISPGKFPWNLLSVEPIYVSQVKYSSQGCMWHYNVFQWTCSHIIAVCIRVFWLNSYKCSDQRSALVAPHDHSPRDIHASFTLQVHSLRSPFFCADGDGTTDTGRLSTRPSERSRHLLNSPMNSGLQAVQALAKPECPRSFIPTLPTPAVQLPRRKCITCADHCSQPSFDWIWLPNDSFSESYGTHRSQYRQ